MFWTALIVHLIIVTFSFGPIILMNCLCSDQWGRAEDMEE